MTIFLDEKIICNPHDRKNNNTIVRFKILPRAKGWQMEIQQQTLLH